jgi:hypothetical protein
MVEFGNGPREDAIFNESQLDLRGFACFLDGGLQIRPGPCILETPGVRAWFDESGLVPLFFVSTS